jgi:hypothetical protein
MLDGRAAFREEFALDRVAPGQISKEEALG